MSEPEWLRKLKAGDEVAVASGNWTTHYEFHKVEKVTTRFIVVCGKNYRIGSGNEAGGRYYSSIVEATPELKAKIARSKRRQFLEQALNGVKWTKLADGQLEAVYAVLPAAVSKE